MTDKLTKPRLQDLVRDTPFFHQNAPPTVTSTVTLTGAQMLGGILEANPSSSTASYTTLTGALLDEAIGRANLAVNDAFDLIIINTSTSAGGNIILLMGTGITLVGNNDIEEEDNVANSSSARFRFRRTAADTWTCYRIA